MRKMMIMMVYAPKKDKTGDDVVVGSLTAKRVCEIKKNRISYLSTAVVHVFLQQYTFRMLTHFPFPPKATKREYKNISWDSDYTA